MKFLRDPRAILTALCGCGLVLHFTSQDVRFAYSSVVFGSYFALSAAYGALKERTFDVNFLMVFAAAGAVYVKRPAEAAILLFLFSLSSTLESFALSRTKSAIESLIKLRPDRAIRVTQGRDEIVDVKELKVGDTVRVLPFEQVAVDGTVVNGQSSVDQAAMTGESEPVYKSPGDKVFAGTQNLEGVIEFTVSSAAGDTTLERIVDLVREAQENKASGEKISSWFGQRYTILVVVSFLASFAFRMIVGQQFDDSLYAALTLLVALSPCALVISTPASTLSALAFAGRNGMLIRGGEFIEEAGRVNAVAIDKTGTLTEGKFRLSEICVCSELVATGINEKACVQEDACWHGDAPMSEQAAYVLRMAAAVEQYSTHPIAEAIVLGARNAGLDVPEATQGHSTPGLGLTAVVQGVDVQVGQRRFFESNGGGLPNGFATHVEGIQRMGMTAVVVKAGSEYAALGLRDEPRPGVSKLLAQLEAMGITRVSMLTGDHAAAAEAIAAETGIKEVHAGLMPLEKATIVTQMLEEGSRVMMVGDGVNDAPVLATANIGVAMGGLGSDIALNSADVVLMQDRLEGIPTLIRLGRMTNGIIRANLLFASGVIVFLTASTFLFGYLFPNAKDWILPFAVVGHEGSTVLVILNGLRLLKGPAAIT